MGGGIFTSANPAFTQDELAYQLKDSRARFLLAASLYLEKVFEGAKLAAMIGRRYMLSNPYKEKVALTWYFPELVKATGNQVAPAELEAVLL